MLVLQPVGAVLRAARLLLPVREAGPNSGRFVEAIQASTGNTAGDPWCASTVYYVGRGMLGTAWPIPKSASCDVQLECYRTHGELHTTPMVGDQFFLMRTATDAVHTGLVEAVSGRAFSTLEGNTSGGASPGSRDGDGFYAGQRGGPGDGNKYLFGRWVRLVR